MSKDIMSNFLRYNFRMQWENILKLRCKINSCYTHRMDIDISKLLSMMKASYHVLIKNSNSQEISSRAAFEAVADFNHPINHLSPYLFTDLMPHQWIRTCTKYLRYLFTICKLAIRIKNLLSL